MRKDYLDEMEEFAAEYLIARNCPPGMVVYSLAKRFPDVSGLSLAFVMSWIAVIVEKDCANLDGKDFQSSTAIYRAVALLAADIFELEEILKHSVYARDLLARWSETSDEYFLL